MSDEIGILRQRTIEAAFAKGVYEEMAAELGEERAREILARAVIRMAKAAGAAWAMAAPDGKTDLATFEAPDTCSQ